MSRISWLAIGLVLVLGFTAYANSLSNPFIWDDYNLIVNNPYIKDTRLITYLFTKDLGYGTQFSNFYRPLQSLSFALDYRLWGLKPFGFHLTSLLLHIGCALVVYFLLSLIFPDRRLIPLITSIFFLLHPAQTEAVTYVSGRADPQAGLFILLSIFLYIKSTHSLRLKNTFYLAGASLSFILALLSKETALILPLLILLYEVSFSQDDLRFKDKLISRYWPYFLVALIYILLRMSALNFLERSLFASKTSVYLRMLTQIKVFALYFGILILPVNLHMERSIPLVTSILDKGVLLSAALFIVMVVLIVRSYKYARVYFFAGMWFFINLIPVSNLVPLNANMAEHWLYLPSIGFCLIIAYQMEQLLKRKKSAKILAIILLAAIICFYSFLTFRRNRQWREPITFFQSILRYNPRSTEAHNCLGAIYKGEGKLDLAIKHFREAVKINPKNFKSYGNLGSALRRKGEYEAAIDTYERAIKLQPGIPGLYNNLGNVYLAQGKFSPAEKTFKKALKLYPEFGLCRINLGKTYYQMGNIEDAIKEYKQAIALEPDLLLGYYNLAIAYQRQRKYDLAIQEYKRLISIEPKHVQAHLNLGTAYNMQGELDQAKEQYHKVLELDPEFFHAYHNLGVIYFKKKQYSLARDNFLKALKINPGYRPSMYFLERLEQDIKN